jgi:hypothetical protein
MACAARSHARRRTQRRARILTAAPNGLELTGDGGAAAGVRCSDVLGTVSPAIRHESHLDNAIPRKRRSGTRSPSLRPIKANA